MCGIIGFSGQVKEGQWRETYQMLESLFLECEHRGRNATGFTAVTHPFSSQLSTSIVTEKAPINATEFIHTNQAWRSLSHKRCSTVLGHVRYATNGNPLQNENNHPHTSDDIHIVHNGVIHNFHYVAKMNCLNLSTQCDSEVLLRLLECHLDIADGLRQCLSVCHGSMAVAAYDWSRDMVYLTRNTSRPLCIMKFKGDQRWWFASTQFILKNAMKKTFGEKYEIELLVSLGENLVYELNPMTGQLLISEAGIE